MERNTAGNYMVTIHSMQRMKERCNTRSEEAERKIALALERGLRWDTFPKKERDYLERRVAQGAEPRVFDGCVYIFSEGRCVTVFPVPEWFGKRGIYDGKIYMRHVKSYTRLYGRYS